MPTSPLQFRRFHFIDITSTNDYARELLADFPLVLVTADHQSAGRGRRERPWIGAHGQNIYMSVGVHHTRSAALFPQEPLHWQVAAVVAVERALRSLFPASAFAIKYPNDIYAQESDGIWRKLSGTLIENEFLGSALMRTVVGIGINVAQEDFPAEVAAIATSLKRLGVLADVERITATVMEELCLLLDQPPAALLREWRQRLAIEGKLVQVLGSQEEWEAVEVRDDGRLVLRNTANGEQIAVDSADSVRYRLGGS